MQPYWESVQAPQPLGVRYIHPRRSVGTGSRERILLSSDDSVSSQDPCPSSSEHADPDEVSDSDDSAVMPSAQPKRTRASMPLSLSSGDKNGIPHYVPHVFDEAGFVDRVADRAVDCLIKPMVERLSQQLIPQMKQLIEDLSRRSRQSPSQPSPPQPPREVHDQVTFLIMTYSQTYHFNLFSHHICDSCNIFEPELQFLNLCSKSFNLKNDEVSLHTCHFRLMQAFSQKITVWRVLKLMRERRSDLMMGTRLRCGSLYSMPL